MQILTLGRIANEKARLQQQREEEALAKRRVQKSSLPERAMAPARVETPAEPSAGGPPRLALAGSKPSWRDREAQRQADIATGRTPEPVAAQISLPANDTAVPAEQPRRPGGYVPPARRDREDGAGAPNARDESTGGDRWRVSRVPREGADAGRDSSPAEGRGGRSFLSAGRRDSGRDVSPATGGPGAFVPRFRRDGGVGSTRPEVPPSSESSASGAGTGEGSGTNAGGVPVKGKWVPPHLR